MSDLYIAGIDGIDIGKSQTSNTTKDPSDFCIVIKKRVMGNHEPMIVAMYKDRPNEVNTAYKIALCLIKYYNAKVNVEATRVGFLNWAKTAGQLHYFMKRPKATQQILGQVLLKLMVLPLLMRLLKCRLI